MCTGTHAYIRVENTARLELVYTAFGQVVENVLHVKKNDVWDETSLNQLAENAATAWTTNMAPLTASAITLTLVRATDLTNEHGIGVEFTPTAGNVGTDTAPALPLGTTVATKFSSSKTGRSFRGRAYFVGLSGDGFVGNSLTGAHALAISEAWAAFFADIAIAMPGVAHVVVSYCQNGSWLAVGETTYITNYHTDIFIDSQRRRLTGRGQ